MSEGWRGCLQGFSQLMEMWLERETRRYKRSAALKRTSLHRNTQPRGGDGRASPRHVRPIPGCLLDRLLPRSLQISAVQPDLAPSVLAPIRYNSAAFAKMWGGFPTIFFSFKQQSWSFPPAFSYSLGSKWWIQATN